MHIRNLVFIFFTLLFITMPFQLESHASDSRKLWSNMCASCHDGRTAPNMESMRSKYVTIDAFTMAVKSKGHQCMNILKNDESLIKKIGREIGLKDTGQE